MQISRHRQPRACCNNLDMQIPGSLIARDSETHARSLLLLSRRRHQQAKTSLLKGSCCTPRTSLASQGGSCQAERTRYYFMVVALEGREGENFLNIQSLHHTHTWCRLFDVGTACNSVSLLSSVSMSSLHSRPDSLERFQRRTGRSLEACH